MKIRAVDACYPGSSHDSFVWNVSSARQYFLKKYESVDRTSKLLGDCGYGIEPFLLTPYRDPRYNSKEYKFNLAHSSLEILWTIGVLKSRFRCLLITLHYRPEKVVKIINVCCALHNICRDYNVEYNDDSITLPSNDTDENVESPPNATLKSEDVDGVEK
ncbi:putative nuclease HARBI1 [Rhagoletis pomonella]|uniref:putative nuclease HARBI1 n=1 Tax=Rhagoletis pomonella TaxID=28610 RepID=UPI00177AB597|nr:putative nuclease HARBI1 [Rhagoletis pomonella]